MKLHLNGPQESTQAMSTGFLFQTEEGIMYQCGACQEVVPEKEEPYHTQWCEPTRIAPPGYTWTPSSIQGLSDHIEQVEQQLSESQEYKQFDPYTGQYVSSESDTPSTEQKNAYCLVDGSWWCIHCGNEVEWGKYADHAPGCEGLNIQKMEKRVERLERRVKKQSIVYQLKQKIQHLEYQLRHSSNDNDDNNDDGVKVYEKDPYDTEDD